MRKKIKALLWGTILSVCFTGSPAARAQVTSITALPCITVVRDHDPFQIKLTVNKMTASRYSVTVDVLRNKQPSTSGGTLAATVRLLIPGAPASPLQTITVPNPTGSSGTSSKTLPAFTLPANVSTVSVEYNGWLNLPHHVTTLSIPLIVTDDLQARLLGQKLLRVFEIQLRRYSRSHPYRHRHHHRYHKPSHPK